MLLCSMIISENVDTRFAGDAAVACATAAAFGGGCCGEALPALGRRAVGEAAATPPAAASASAFAVFSAASASHGIKRVCLPASGLGEVPISLEDRRLDRQAVVGTSRRADMHPRTAAPKR